MNIFFTGTPEESAAFLDDKRVCKMIVETAQLLSTYLIDQLKLTAPYKVYNTKHPSYLWLCESKANYNWLVKHYKALLEEYKNRYEKVYIKDFTGIFELHASEDDKITRPPNVTYYKDINPTSIEEIALIYKCYLFWKWSGDKNPKKHKKNLSYSLEEYLIQIWKPYGKDLTFEKAEEDKKNISNVIIKTKELIEKKKIEASISTNPYIVGWLNEELAEQQGLLVPSVCQIESVCGLA